MLLALAFACGAGTGVIVAYRARRAVLLDAGRQHDADEAHLDLLAEEVVRLKGERDEARAQVALVPDVADSPALSANVGAPIFDQPRVHRVDLVHAVGHVVTYGLKMRSCASCNEKTTSSLAHTYQWNGEEVDVLIEEDCQSCGNVNRFKVGAVTWAAMEAARAWEGTRTAYAVMRSEIQTDLDLGELDQ